MKNQYNVLRAIDSASTGSADAGASRPTRGQRQARAAATRQPTVSRSAHANNLRGSLTCLHNLLATRLLTGSPPPATNHQATTHEPDQRVGRETRAELAAAMQSKKRQQQQQVARRLRPVAAIGGNESRAAELLEMTKCYEEIDQIYDYIRGLSPLPTNLKRIKCIDFEQINESERRKRLVDVQRRQRRLVELQKLRQTGQLASASEGEQRRRPTEVLAAKSGRSAGPIRVTATARETKVPVVERVESLNVAQLPAEASSSSSGNKSSLNKATQPQPVVESELSSSWSASSWAQDLDSVAGGDNKRTSRRAGPGDEMASRTRRFSAGTKSHSDYDNDDDEDRTSSTSGHEDHLGQEPAPDARRQVAHSADSARKLLVPNLSSSPSSGRPTTSLSAESAAKSREELIRLIDEDEDAAEHIYEQIPARVSRAELNLEAAPVGTGGQCRATSAPTQPAFQRKIKQNLPFDYLSRPISTLLRAAPPLPPPVPLTSKFREQPTPLHIGHYRRHLSMSNLHLIRTPHYQVPQQRQPAQICQFSSPGLRSEESYRVAQSTPAHLASQMFGILGLRHTAANCDGDAQAHRKGIISKRFVWHTDRQPVLGANRRRRLTAIGIELADLDQLRAGGRQFGASKQAIGQDEQPEAGSLAGRQQRLVSRHLNSLSSNLHSICSSDASGHEAKSSSSSSTAPRDNRTTCGSRPTEDKTGVVLPVVATQSPRLAQSALKSDCPAQGDIPGGAPTAVKDSACIHSDHIRQEEAKAERRKGPLSSRGKLGSRLLAGLSLIGLDTIGDTKPLASKATRVSQEACKSDKVQPNGLANEQPSSAPKLLHWRQGVERKRQPNKSQPPPLSATVTGSRDRPSVAAQRTSCSGQAAGGSGGATFEIPRLSKRSHLLNRPLPQPPKPRSSSTERRRQQQASRLHPNRTLIESWSSASAARLSLAAGDKRPAPSVNLNQILRATTSKPAQSKPIVATQISPTCTSSGISSRLASATCSRRAADYQVAKLGRASAVAADLSSRALQRADSELVSRILGREDADFADQCQVYDDKESANQNMTNLKQFDEKFAADGADQPLVSSNDSLFESINQFSKRSIVKTRAPKT